MYEYYALNQNRKTNRTIKNNTLHEFWKEKSFVKMLVNIVTPPKRNKGKWNRRNKLGWGKKTFLFVSNKVDRDSIFCTKSFFCPSCSIPLCLGRVVILFPSLSGLFLFLFFFFLIWTFFQFSQIKKLTIAQWPSHYSWATHQRANKTIYYYRRNKKVKLTKNEFLN